MMNEFTYTPCYKSMLEAMPPDWYTSESMVLIMNMSRIKTPIRVYQKLYNLSNIDIWWLRQGESLCVPNHYSSQYNSKPHG